LNKTDNYHLTTAIELLTTVDMKSQITVDTKNDQDIKKLSGLGSPVIGIPVRI